MNTPCYRFTIDFKPTAEEGHVAPVISHSVLEETDAKYDRLEINPELLPPELTPGADTRSTQLFYENIERMLLDLTRYILTLHRKNTVAYPILFEDLQPNDIGPVAVVKSLITSLFNDDWLSTFQGDFSSLEDPGRRLPYELRRHLQDALNTYFVVKGVSFVVSAADQALCQTVKLADVSRWPLMRIGDECDATDRWLNFEHYRLHFPVFD